MILSILLSLAFSSPCKVDNFYKVRETGFYYKKLCIEEEEKKKEEKKPERKVKIPWEKLDKMDWKEIRKLVEEVRGIAVMNPTYENVREYKKLMLWITKKALEFQKMDRLVTLTSGDVFSVSIASPYYSNVHSLETDKKIEKVIREFKDRAGLVVFYDPVCAYCKKYIPIVREFSRQAGWEVLFVNVREFPNASRKLGVRMVPDTFVVLKKENKKLWQRAGTGAFTLDALKRNVVLALTLLGKVKYEEVFSNP